MISLAVAAAGWVGVSSPGDYATLEFPPLLRHDLVLDGYGMSDTMRRAVYQEDRSARRGFWRYYDISEIGL